ncbi:DUF6542 domain-containing protein [Streptomyces aidingensis]|uniref:DUF6542 domain-containing protein n=1 Tax=Streptomyces aidingensis TaxID=910347 RepID=A0A1I1ERZ5_9ACTN|nr:DUF6542 domain-containing protein [Streptomyces aidingensis]SFB89416.1 hypothetical protein SAMN05421773_101417 [Streptomyces aidingensis]
MPRPRLTGLGCGVLACAAMSAAGWLSVLLGGAPACYGVLFLAVGWASALWVRPADLICAPVAAPIAFALGVLATGEGTGVVTYLALHAPWLFAGTLLTLVVVLVRGVRRAAARRRRRRAVLAAAGAAGAAGRA